MQRFLQHIMAVFAVFALIVGLWHLLFVNLFGVIDSVDSKLWLWGDSQVYAGINPDKLDHNKPVFSVADHGLGFQDLLMFSKRVPDDATALVGFGPLYYRYNQDRSSGGLSFESIESLFRARFDYGLDLDLYGILRRNVAEEFSVDAGSPSKHTFFKNEPNLRKRDKFIRSLGMMPDQDQFQQIFQFKDEYLFRSLDVLDTKTNTWHMLSLPLSADLEETAFNRIQQHFDSVLQEVSSRYNMPLDTLFISVAGDEFYDATHFTQSAAERVSPLVGRALTSNTKKRILIIRFR